MSASIEEIPLTPDNQQFAITLGGQSLRMTLIWRGVAGWILDLYDAMGNPMVLGVPLIPDTDLLASYPFVGLNGKLVVKSDTPYPTEYNLGSGARLYFLQETTA
ncbi:bacteriophage protein [Serratia marcescens]|uniref:phage baseplate plug family protein n=1 Tax=Serratia marcescens TaxID=615 RepID=UPI00062C2BCA|nr:hypothetical protein [Serratia marcescens]KKZ19030.1 bacteriophage protein [Serratia marcescens]